MNRRTFARTGAAALAAPLVVPRRVLGGKGFLAPSDTVNLAAIGAGGMGASNMAALTDHHVVALADVDFAHVMRGVQGRSQPREGEPDPRWVALEAKYTRAARFSDFRRMFDRHAREIDAVVIATPDHVHAVAALTAMALGKHVYVQKPLTYTVEEARALKAAAAARPRLVTQMGNQGHSGDDGRRVVEVVRAGVLGPIREVLAWTDRPRGWWPQGVPKRAPEPVPAGLDWDAFLGPAPDQPYAPAIHPFAWRGYVDFGVGALGDMGAHLLDFPFWALDLGLPSGIETRHTPWGGEPERLRAGTPDTYPVGTVTTYRFARRPALAAAGTGPFTLTWYDGGLMPPTPVDAPDGFRLNPDGGVMFVGERGTLVHETYGQNPRFLPDGLAAEAARVPQSLPRVAGGIRGHEANWIRAIRGEEPASCPFAYAADLNELMLLGLVAARADRPLVYDAAGMRFPNAPEADRFLRRTYRPGWALPSVG